MSLIVKDQKTEQISILTKGADNIMLPRCTINSKDKEITQKHLYHFACTGLRTLVMGQKDISEDYFNDWFFKYKEVNTSNSMDKDTQLQTLYDELEQDLEYVGSSAIEDLLQEDVPETI